VGHGRIHCLGQNKQHELVSESQLKRNNIDMIYQIGADGFRFKEAALMRANFKLLDNAKRNHG
jgi:hypothetical protein